MKILAIDAGNRCGWAQSDPPASGVADFTPRPGDLPGVRWVRFSDWLRLDMLPGVTLLVYERWTASPGVAAKIGAGYVTRIEEVVARENWYRPATVATPDLLEVSPAELKRWLTGNGRASKDQVRTEAISRGWVHSEASSFDEVDAIALLHYGMEHAP